MSSVSRPGRKTMRETEDKESNFVQSLATYTLALPAFVSILSIIYEDPCIQMALQIEAEHCHRRPYS